jgi:uncharacterized membrane protein (TIGR02234 family)
LIASVEGTDIPATGSEALALLQPLALAGLALTLALALVGKVVRFVFAALAIVIGGALTALVVPIVQDPPVSAVARVVTEHTGIAGVESVSAIVSGIEATGWPVVTLVAAIVVALGGALALVTGRSWRKGTSRYDAPKSSPAGGDGPLDAVDSWDRLTRGGDPTD